MECCGFREICNLSGIGPERAIKEICDAQFVSRYASNSYSITRVLDLSLSHAVFTEVQNGTYGKNLAAYIRKHKLGTVIGSRISTNPNSGNRLKGYIWTINKRALSAWHKKHSK